MHLCICNIRTLTRIMCALWRLNWMKITKMVKILKRMTELAKSNSTSNHLHEYTNCFEYLNYNSFLPLNNEGSTPRKSTLKVELKTLPHDNSWTIVRGYEHTNYRRFIYHTSFPLFPHKVLHLDSSNPNVQAGAQMHQYVTYNVYGKKEKRRLNIMNRYI